MTAADMALSECPTGMATRILECSVTTLFNKARRGELEYRMTKSGRRLWNVKKYLERAEQKAAC